ncbi:MAG: hypothetical protein GYA66_11955 [Phyllobacteriaceae bacterium]|nr:hypothetical protein [Phyllobacteriaceae bacterium]
MSQTETLLLVALGFAFALVLAMIFGFGIWSAANRWASYKRKREVPTTILDMQAEREGLRAQNAMTSRRLEFMLEEARYQAAEKTAQVTRHRNRAIVMSKDLIAKDAEIASLRALAAELTSETNKRARIIAKLTGHEVTKLRSFDLPVPQGVKPFTVPKPVAQPAPAEVAADAAPLDRIKAKIAELNALSAQIADQQSAESRAVDATLAAREAQSEPLMLSAMREEEDAMATDPAGSATSVEAGPEPEPVSPPADATPEPVAEAAAIEPVRRMTLAEKFRSLKDGVSS